jgi:hypothetical protein
VTNAPNNCTIKSRFTPAMKHRNCKRRDANLGYSQASTR